VGQGWDADQWGRWPTADDLESVAPGRRVAIWAHDHHALWVSHAALRAAGIDEATADPTGGVIGRDATGRPDGMLYEGAGHLVDVHLPLPSAEELDAGIVEVARELVALGVVACHDPGGIAPDPDLRFSYASYARLADAGRLPLRVHASMRDDGIPAAAERGLRSGRPLGGDPSGRATVGWQKCFADGSLGSRTAALLEDVEPEEMRPLPPNQRRGVWNTDRDTLAALVDRAAVAGIATQIHAIGDAAARVALDVLTPGAATSPLMPRLEHVQLLDPADRPRFAEAGIAASVQPVHLASDAAKARLLWGARAESNGYPLASLAATGAVLAFGTDAPVESFDPWPGIAMAVCRADPGWPAGTKPYGPQEALSLDRAIRAACVDPAVMAREPDRGRLTVGKRADIVVVPAAAIDEPVTPGGPLGATRPTLVLLDGEVAFER
jgi:hypothetical protein